MSYTAADVEWFVKDLTRRANDIIYRINRIRFKYGARLVKRLQTAFSSVPSVIEVNGYQTYVWVPAYRRKEYRVWPYSLTAKSGSWLDSRPYAPASPPVPVNWAVIYSKLAANFSINTAVLHAIRDALTLVTQASITASYQTPEDWVGRVQYGAYIGWYKLSGDGIVVGYYDPSVDRWVEGRIATSESSGCDAKERLRTAMESVLKGLTIKCDGTTVVFPYEAPLCSDLDQIVTYIRQVIDKQVYCPFVFPDSILFIDGPLIGLSYTYQTGRLVILYDGKTATLLNVDDLLKTLETAVNNCVEKLKGYACVLRTTTTTTQSP
mgnify:CR=1 FL=1